MENRQIFVNYDTISLLYGFEHLNCHFKNKDHGGLDWIGYVKSMNMFIFF